MNCPWLAFIGDRVEQTGKIVVEIGNVGSGLLVLLTIRRIYFVLCVLAVVLSSTGCFGPIAAYGIKETDLSWVKVGIHYTSVEGHLGVPISSELTEGGSRSVYVYNRGFIPPKEQEGEGAQAGALVVGVAVDLLTVGMAGAALTMCVDTCQLGHLEVHYDDAGKLLSARDLGAAPAGER